MVWKSIHFVLKKTHNYALALLNNSGEKEDTAYFVNGPQEIDHLAHILLPIFRVSLPHTISKLIGKLDKNIMLQFVIFGAGLLFEPARNQQKNYRTTH